MKKYLLIPGNIKSDFSGDLIWISALQLAKKYNVAMSDCLVHTNKMIKVPEDIIILQPQQNNEYEDYSKG